MHHRDHRPGEALKRELAGSLDQGISGRRYVICEYRLPSAPLGKVRQLHLDATIAMAHLSQHRIGGTDTGGDGGHPLLAFFIGADDQRLVDFRGDPVRQQRRAMQCVCRDRIKRR